MADPKVDSPEMTEDTIHAIEDVARELLETTDLPNETKLAIEWAIDGVLDATETGVNEAQADQVLETVLRANVDKIVSGAKDDQMPRIEELLNKVIAGLDDGLFTIGNFDTTNERGSPEDKAKRKAQAAFSDYMFTTAATMDYLEDNWTEKAQSLTNDITAGWNALTSGSLPQTQDNDMKNKIAALRAEIHVILQGSPAYQALTTDQERNDFIDKMFLEKLADDLGISVEELKEKLIAMKESNDPEAFKQIVERIQETRASIYQAHLAETNLAKSVTEVMKSMVAMVTIGDPNVSKEYQLECLIESIGNTVDAQNQNIETLEATLHQIEIQLDRYQKNIISSTDAATIDFLEAQMDALIDKREELEKTHLKAQETNIFFDKVTDFVQNNEEALLDCKTPEDIMALAMADGTLMSAWAEMAKNTDMSVSEQEETFKAMTSALGISDAHAETAFQVIQFSGMATQTLQNLGIKVANTFNLVFGVKDPDEEAIATLETKIAELNQEKLAFEESTANIYQTGPIYEHIQYKLVEFNASIAELETTLTDFKNLQNAISAMKDFKAEVDYHAENNIPHHFSPDKAAEILAQMEADIQAMRDEINGVLVADANTDVEADAQARAPAPDPAQAALDAKPKIKSYLANLGATHGISEAALRDELEKMGISSDQLDAVVSIAETQLGVNVSPKIDTVVSNHTTLSANKAPGEAAAGMFNAAATNVAGVQVTPTPDGPQIITPEEIAANGQEFAANTTDKPVVTMTGGMT